MLKIDAAELNYRELNQQIRNCYQTQKQIEIINLNGQRYLATGLRGGNVKLKITGTIGNNLAAFAEELEIIAHGDVQDGVGNTMNSGTIEIHGNAGDIAGYAMRGGKLWIGGDAGYRCGIHMKAFEERQPTIIIKGRCGDFLGEYMAGGVIVVLGLGSSKPPTGRYTGTGMHGGVIYLRGRVPEELLAPEVERAEISGEDVLKAVPDLASFLKTFAIDRETIAAAPFLRLTPKGKRPYGKLYAH